MNQDVARLLTAARNAIKVIRHNAEQLETIGQHSTAERDAVNQLNMAVQLLEYRITLSHEGTDTLECRGDEVAQPHGLFARVKR